MSQNTVQDALSSGFPVALNVATNHGAGGAMAGYLWQAVEACRRSLTLPPGAVLSVERHDDIAVSRLDGTELCCEQLKHSQDPATIGEESPTWWAAIGVWADKPPSNVKTRILVATDAIQGGTLLAACYHPTSMAPWAALEAKMTEIAEAEPNQARKAAYRAWLSLDTDSRRGILESIEVKDQAASLNDSIAALDDQLLEEGVQAQNLAGVRDSFLGAFMSLLISGLNSNGFEVTALKVKQTFMEAAARVMESGYYEFPELAIDPADMQVLKAEKMIHVIPQLAAIGQDSSPVVMRVMETWFKARAHRDRIMNTSAHAVADLGQHDGNLVAYCETQHEIHPTSHGEPAKEVGRKVHGACMTFQTGLGKTQPDLRFIQGSYYELSNDVKVRWHPGYPLAEESK